MAVKNLFTLGIGVSPGSVAPLILLGLGVNPGFSTPATALDVSHQWQLTVNGTDRWANVEGVITYGDNEGGEVGTLRCILRETGAALGISEFQEVILKDGSTAVWGGYVTIATPLIDRLSNANRLSWELTAESWATILNRTRPVRKSYYGDAPGAILADLFDQALDPDGAPPNQTEFDTSTYVTAGSWSDDFVFSADGERISDVLDRLALLAGYVWWIDAAKAVHFGPVSDATAPFSVAVAGDADYAASFPVEAGSWAKRIDASDIRNRVTVRGGTKVSAVTSDSFTGDGSTLVFVLSNRPITEIVAIGVGGVRQTFGTDWYHSFDDYDCLVNYSHGTVRWDTGNAPPDEDLITVSYRYGEQVLVTVDNGTAGGSSYDTYGRWFEYELVDRSITNLATATAIAQAMVDEYEFGLISGAFDVRRLGIEAGQRVQVENTALGLTGYYPARKVVTDVGKLGLVRCSVQFGGRRARLGMTLAGNVHAGYVTPGGAPSDAAIAGASGNRPVQSDRGQKFTVYDYGSSIADTDAPSGLPSKMLSFVSEDDATLHQLQAWNDTAASQSRQVLYLGSNPTNDERGYLLLQTLAQKEAWARLRAVGGYDLAGQQDASVNVYAYRQEGNWDHTRIALDADTLSVEAWTGASEPDPGTGSLPDGLLVYTDGTWDPGSGEGWYMRINGAWRPIAVVAGAVMQIGATLDLLDYHLRSVGNLEFANASTQTANFTAGANTVYVVNTGTGNVTATLPALSGISDNDVRMYVFIKVSADGNQMIIDGDGAETINGATTQATATQYTVFRVMSRGTEWLLW